MSWVTTAIEAAGGRQQLAELVGVSPQSLWLWANGARTPEPAACVRVETETRGAVRRWDMRPHDWHLIWPELIGADGAPDVPAPADKAH